MCLFQNIFGCINGYSVKSLSRETKSKFTGEINMTKTYQNDNFKQNVLKIS